MTDTTKPTGDTIDRDDVLREVEAGFDAWDWEHPDGQPPIPEVIGSVTDAVWELVQARLVERPNRAVARGDRERIAMWFAKQGWPSFKWDEMTDQMRGRFLYKADELLADLTTPTETQEESK